MPVYPTPFAAGDSTRPASSTHGGGSGDGGRVRKPFHSRVLTTGVMRSRACPVRQIAGDDARLPATLVRDCTHRGGAAAEYVESQARAAIASSTRQVCAARITASLVSARPISRHPSVQSAWHAVNASEEADYLQCGAQAIGLGEGPGSAHRGWQLAILQCAVLKSTELLRLQALLRTLPAASTDWGSLPGKDCRFTPMRRRNRVPGS